MTHARQEEIATALADWLIDRTDGDPVMALLAMAEVAAEMIKTAPDPMKARATFITGLNGFLRLPNRYLTATDPH